MSKAQTKPSILAPLLTAAGLLYAAHWLETHILEEPIIRLLAAGLRLMAQLIVIKSAGRVLTLLLDVLRLFRSWRKSTLKGSAGWLSVAQARKAKLDRRTPGGRLLGVLGDVALWVTSETHQLIIGPSGTQKSTAVYLPALCSISDSVLVSDTKKELFPVTAEYRRKHMGHRIVLLDPEDSDTACVNPLDTLASLISLGSPRALTFARALATQLKPAPSGQDPNKFFTLGSQGQLVTLLCAVAAVCPAEHRVLGTVNKALSDLDFLHELLERAMAVTALNGAIAELANSLHIQAFGDDGAAKTFEQFRLGAVQATEIYAKGGPLEHITSKTTFSFADLKQEKVSAYLVVDYSNQDASGPWAGLMQWLASWELVQERNNTPVYLLLDEFCNAPLHGLPKILTLLRSYGVRCIMATQDLEDVNRVYGKHALETVLSEASIKQFLGGIRSQTTLEYLSKYLGNKTERAASYSGNADGMQESTSLTDRPLLTPDELRRLDKRMQIAIIDNHRPALLTKVQIHAIAPWRRQIGINTMYGPRRYLRPVEVRVGRRGASVTRRGRMSTAHAPSRWRLWAALGVMLSPGTWLIAAAAIVLISSQTGLPHLRASYGYTGPLSARQFTWCRYIGPDPFTTYGPNCPFIIFRNPK